MPQSIRSRWTVDYLRALERRRLRPLHHDHVAEVLREQRLRRRLRRGLTGLLVALALTGVGALLLMP